MVVRTTTEEERVRIMVRRSWESGGSGSFSVFGSAVAELCAPDVSVAALEEGDFGNGLKRGASISSATGVSKVSVSLVDELCASGVSAEGLEGEVVFANVLKRGVLGSPAISVSEPSITKSDNFSAGTANVDVEEFERCWQVRLVI